MRFITTFEDFHQKIGDHHVYIPMEEMGHDHNAVIRTFIREHVRPNDMDNGFGESFQVRMDDGRCFQVAYEAWIEHDPHWEIKDSVDIEEIPLETCEIKEAPGAFVMREEEITSPDQLVFAEDSVILGVRLLSPPTMHGRTSYRNSTSTLPIVASPTGETAVRMNISTFNASLLIPLSVLLENGCEVKVRIKSPVAESPDDSPSP